LSVKSIITYFTFDYFKFVLVMIDNDDINITDYFLVEEYKAANELTLHVDNFRNKLTSFYLTFAGIALSGIVFLFQNNIVDERTIYNMTDIIGLLMMLVTVIGFLFIGVLARSRRIQLEQYGIINNIREYFIKNDVRYWNILQLSKYTLPKARLFTGTYYWVLIIMILNAVICFIAVYLMCYSINNILSLNALSIGAITFVPSLFIQHKMYFKIANNIKARKYVVKDGKLTEE